MPTAITADNKDQLDEGTWVLDFWAEWCPPCKQMEPIFEDMAQQHADVQFGKVDVDSMEDMAQQFGVMSIPTFVILQDGQEVDRTTGGMAKDKFNEWIQEQT